MTPRETVNYLFDGLNLRKLSKNHASTRFSPSTMRLLNVELSGMVYVYYVVTTGEVDVTVDLSTASHNLIYAEELSRKDISNDLKDVASKIKSTMVNLLGNLPTLEKAQEAMEYLDLRHTMYDYHGRRAVSGYMPLSKALGQATAMKIRGK